MGVNPYVEKKQNSPDESEECHSYFPVNLSSHINIGDHMNPYHNHSPTNISVFYFGLQALIQKGRTHIVIARSMRSQTHHQDIENL